MPFVDSTTAKLHLRVDNSVEDALIAIWLVVADQQVTRFLNRNVYPDGMALAAAIAAAPAALAAATAQYKAAATAADALTEKVDRDAAKRYADDVYALAKLASDMAQAGIEINDTLKAAILLNIGDLYEKRGADGAGFPAASRNLLMPYRHAMGV